MDLQKGGKIVTKQCRHLDWKGCNRVEFRAVGDNVVGWAKLVPVWGGSMDSMVHFGQKNQFLPFGP